MNIKKLALIANELDTLGYYALANAVTDEMIKVAAEEEQLPTPEQKERYKEYQENKTQYKTKDLQKMLNYYMTQLNRPAVQLTGVNDEATQSALSFLGIRPGTYSTWGELFDIVHAKGRELLRKQELKQPFEPYSMLAPSKQVEDPLA